MTELNTSGYTSGFFRERQSNPRARHQPGGGAAASHDWTSFWSATSLNNKKSAVASAVYTIVFSGIMVGFASYEMYKLDQFWVRYNDAQTRNYDETQELFNKDMQLVTDNTILFFLNISATEKGLLAAFVCLSLAVIAGSVSLIICTVRAQKELAIPWIVLLVIDVIYGSVLVIMDCVVYEFGAENNLELLVWVSFVLGSIHSLRCVSIYYRHLSGSLSAQPSTAAAGVGSDARHATDHAVFNISESMEPVIIRMTPPPYEKDPPVYSFEPEDVSSADTTSTTNLSSTQEKPPDYTP